MSITGVQGRLLEVTVVGCSKLKDTEWITRQDPYVVLEYGSTKFRSRTCKDGGKNPVFQEKYVFTLIEGLREISAVVWNSNTLTYDDFIGSGKIQLQDVLSRGYDDKSWSLQTKTGRYAGELKLIMHFDLSSKPASSHSPSAPPYLAPSQGQVPVYSTIPHASAAPYRDPNVSYPPPATAYPAQSAPYPPPGSAYPTQSTAYPSYPPPDSSIPPGSVPYLAFPYPPPASTSAYPPPVYSPPGYPSLPYPPPHVAPPPYGSPGYHPGMYPPPPPRPY